MTRKVQTDTPQEIAPDTYWVGKRAPNSIFHANPYLRIFPGGTPERREAFTLLIDPGSPSDCAVVAQQVSHLIGSPAALTAFFLNHQDPDVAGSIAFFTQRFAPQAAIVCSEDTWRLVVHHGLAAQRFHATERHLAKGLTLPTGQHLRFLPTPYCHFRGATMLFDPETRVLFSGDLFGGLSPAGNTSLWADASAWPGMRAFHQIYMPSRQAIARAIETIRMLNPAPDIIAPQHGALLSGKWIEYYMERLEALPVGIELLDDTDDYVLGWSHVLFKIQMLAQLLSGTDVEPVLAVDEQLADTTKLEKGRRVVVRHGRWTIERVLGLLDPILDAETMNTVAVEALAAAELLQLPAPRVDLARGGSVEVLG